MHTFFHCLQLLGSSRLVTRNMIKETSPHAKSKTIGSMSTWVLQKNDDSEISPIADQVTSTQSAVMLSRPERSRAA
jgi:hypothetical protein